MAPPNFTAKSPIPVYAVALPRSEVILYAGGGGRGRSGVTNAIVGPFLSYPLLSRSERS